MRSRSAARRTRTPARALSPAATVLRGVFGWDMYASATGLVLLTAAYTALGGLAAVIVTDVAQSIVMISGCVMLTAYGLARVGGYAGLVGTPPDDIDRATWHNFFRMYRPPEDPHLPTLGIALGQNIGGLWYWCVDQAIVQRVLAARNLEHARGATVLAGFLKVTPVFLMVLPGIIARRLYSSEVRADTNAALPILMKHLLPPGMLGLMLAAVVASCMSSLDSVFTASASLFCLDVYRPYIRPQSSDAELVRVGRYLCAALSVVTLLWLPVISIISDQVRPRTRTLHAPPSPLPSDHVASPPLVSSALSHCVAHAAGLHLHPVDLAVSRAADRRRLLLRRDRARSPEIARDRPTHAPAVDNSNSASAPIRRSLVARQRRRRRRRLRCRLLFRLRSDARRNNVPNSPTRTRRRRRCTLRE